MVSLRSKPATASDWSYSTTDWQRIEQLGRWVDQTLQESGVRLTMGGEPTFVSGSDFESLQWHTAALGTDKRRLAEQLLMQLQQSFGLGGSLLHHGLGKLYPGESQPRWGLGCYWRADSVPLWTHPHYLISADNRDLTIGVSQTPASAQQFADRLIEQLGISPNGLHEACDRQTGARAGWAIPLLLVQQDGHLRWSTCRWELSNGARTLPLLAGDSPIGLRLPLHDITWSDALTTEAQPILSAPATVTSGVPAESPPNSICVALGLDIRDGVLHVFLPPLSSARSFVDLVGAIEQVAVDTSTPIALEGYPPPANTGISGFQITPDPGVLEVNIHPVNTWPDLVEQTQRVYDAAQSCGLTAWKPTTNGHPTNTGGGAHITIGGSTVVDSPLLRRPDLLRSLLAYWHNHPSLSYVFTGLFVGPTSQAPRLDESRLETLYELDIAFQQLSPHRAIAPEDLDRLLSHLLVDTSGNAHRTALCIDKLYPRNNPRLQLGLLEFRGFAMPPTDQMRLLQLLLVRSLVAMLWQQPYREPLIRWGTQLHDRFLLPDPLNVDLQRVLSDLSDAGMPFQQTWFEPFFNFRFPTYGVAHFNNCPGMAVTLELRQAIEPWNVIGTGGDDGTARLVDTSLARIQIKLDIQDASADRYDVTCNHYRVPLHRLSTNTWVGGVRFRTSTPSGASLPATAPDRQLVFNIIDTQEQRSLGGCTYVPYAQPGGQSFTIHPSHGHRSCSVPSHEISPSPEYPSLLDIRRIPPA
ncbi:MAG: transglutaminase family protein [Cyanobacteria bacterium P01_A01_bin.3]